MKGFGELIFMVLIVLIAMGVLGVLLTPGKSIASEIDSNYNLKEKNGEFRTYQSSDNITNTARQISELKQPYDMEINPGKKSVLLYRDYAVVLVPSSKKTRIEVLRHEKAYRRHNNVIIGHWGTLRNGSIGNPPVRGGGFGFGK
ncbi:MULTISPECIES: DUF4247 domain-containing protein [unclassified Candidatus Frackibacter]|uniref:DUF4247 domain-containing protein n=1 Tax=unclassified Candidatus Frackibacter TaxID=2648818 RepID=UPI000799C462|nr:MULTISPECIES: DUF4247 domain-containing protein [unclassified Candidatus Frackibacter]KXS41544.1 MAG: hypothetical protein AWU54_1602 [Candidatus Frackibacter sp. T328-2]SDC33320.1 protein of unknown function [Candidatus Frackibacter sp. WG11]SEM57786.1 protein of unknown function [Candidatus Frackibacter sp. WG12]SFM09520.1 protein of unknown function [Candidatus Frackibacter sp. WG13]